MKSVLLLCLWAVGPVFTAAFRIRETAFQEAKIPEVSLTITAEKRLLEIVWYDIDWVVGDKIIITEEPPTSFALLGRNWNPKILAEVAPYTTHGWKTTNITFDYNVSRDVNAKTSCYAYWVNYFTWEGELMAVGCLGAYATWMNDLRPGIEKFRISELLIPGTHDAGSYKIGFNPGKWETPATKYSLTQDEDIRGQLMHGARYLDIRPAYYKSLPGQPFYVNHGVTRQRPMPEVTKQVRDFVSETKEFVIFGMKEFPFGFSDDGVHEKFVEYLKDEFDGLIVDPELTWDVTLGELWDRNQFIFLAYDDSWIVSKFRNTLFQSVNQRWGDVQTWDELEIYLRGLYPVGAQEWNRIRPVSDMAELTADALGVALDKYGGLRRMADDVNSNVSMLYREELGEKANIVSVDYIRGTTITELAIKVNKKKIRMV